LHSIIAKTLLPFSNNIDFIRIPPPDHWLQDPIPLSLTLTLRNFGFLGFIGAIKMCNIYELTKRVVYFTWFYEKQKCPYYRDMPHHVGKS
jgi:hypothetical protein